MKESSIMPLREEYVIARDIIFSRQGGFFLPYLREVKESPVFVAPDLLINVLVAEVNKRTSFLTKRF